MENLINNLRKNGFEVVVFENRNEVVPYLNSLIPKGAKVGAGGSETLRECGVIDYLRNGDYTFYDRTVRRMSAEEVSEIFKLEKSTDYYFSGANAITENGEIYNVDGRGNRVSAIAHGPKNVIIISGINKVVKDIGEAVYRVKTVAAPLNCRRLLYKTPCAETGRCISLTKENPAMADGCRSEGRICCQYLVSGFQRLTGRIRVLLVKESLGY